MGPRPEFEIARPVESRHGATRTENQFFFIIPSSFFIPSFDM
jgi:hypothetical protein